MDRLNYAVFYSVKPHTRAMMVKAFPFTDEGRVEAAKLAFDRRRAILHETHSRVDVLIYNAVTGEKRRA